MGEMGSTRAAVFRDGAKEASIETLTVAELREGEVLVKLVATGVCHTDLTCRDGFMALPRPIVLGHEGSGIVEKVAPGVTKVKPGDHVVMTVLGCGHCPSCDAELPAYCNHTAALNFSGRRLDGSSALAAGDETVNAHFFGQSSFATHSVAHQNNVVKVRDDAPLELLGPLGCGIQTGAGTVFHALKPKKDEAIAIFGCGGVGMSAVMAAKILGASPIIVVEPNADRRKLAEELGATVTIDPFAEQNLVAKLQASAPNGLLHAVDTSGVNKVIHQAIEALGMRGQIVLLTLQGPTDTINVPIMSLLGRGASVRGVSEGDSNPDEFIPQMVDYIMSGQMPVDRLVKYYEFDQFNEALEDQEQGRVIKPILRMPA